MIQIDLTSIVTTNKENWTSAINATIAKVTKIMFNENRQKGAGAAAPVKFISQQALMASKREQTQREHKSY